MRHGKLFAALGTVLAVTAVAVVAVLSYRNYRPEPSLPSHEMIQLTKIVVLADIVSVLAFVAVYTAVAKWWRNPIGRTIVFKDLALLAALLPITLSLFFHLSRFDSRISSAADMAALASIGVIMFWRCVVWVRVHRPDSPRDDEHNPLS